MDQPMRAPVLSKGTEMMRFGKESPVPDSQHGWVPGRVAQFSHCLSRA